MNRRSFFQGTAALTIVASFVPAAFADTKIRAPVVIEVTYNELSGPLFRGQPWEHYYTPFEQAEIRSAEASRSPVAHPIVAHHRIMDIRMGVVRRLAREAKLPVRLIWEARNVAYGPEGTMYLPHRALMERADQAYMRNTKLNYERCLKNRNGDLRLRRASDCYTA